MVPPGGIPGSSGESATIQDTGPVFINPRHEHPVNRKPPMGEGRAASACERPLLRCLDLCPAELGCGIAARSLSANGASSRDRKRFCRAIVMTGRETPVSIASIAASVPRRNRARTPRSRPCGGSSPARRPSGPAARSGPRCRAARSRRFGPRSRPNTVFRCISSNPSAYACIRPYSIPLWTHLDEVPGPVGPTRPHPHVGRGSQRFENRRKPSSPLPPPHPTSCCTPRTAPTRRRWSPTSTKCSPCFLERGGPPHRVLVVAVPTVDDDVPRGQAAPPGPRWWSSVGFPAGTITRRRRGADSSPHRFRRGSGAGRSPPLPRPGPPPPSRRTPPNAVAFPADA